MAMFTRALQLTASSLTRTPTRTFVNSEVLVLGMQIKVRNFSFLLNSNSNSFVRLKILYNLSSHSFVSSLCWRKESKPYVLVLYMQAVKKWAFNASGFNQYGLYRDDVLYETDEVKVLLDFFKSLNYIPVLFH